MGEWVPVTRIGKNITRVKSRAKARNLSPDLMNKIAELKGKYKEVRKGIKDEVCYAHIDLLIARPLVANNPRRIAGGRRSNSPNGPNVPLVIRPKCKKVS